MKADDHFFAPDGSNFRELLEQGKLLLEPLAGFLASGNARQLLPSNDLTDLGIAEHGRTAEYIAERLDEVCRSSMNAYHQGYLGHMDSMPTFMSIIGELYTASLNNNMLSYEMSPFFTQVQAKMVQYFAAKFFGPDHKAGGTFLSGGTLSALQAIVMARNAAFNSFRQGIGINKPLVFTSDLGHTSIEKSAMAAGIGTDGVIKVKTNGWGQMDVEDLRQKIDFAIDQGCRPFFINATAGTTVIGSFDTIDELSRVAEAYGLWLHVDAIYGGALVFSDLKQKYLNGIEKADSISFNPQKWLNIGKTCSLLLLRNNEHFEDFFRVGAPYMNDQKKFDNLGETSLQGSRATDVLKLWLSLLDLGEAGYRHLINRSMQLTSAFKSLLSHHPEIEQAPFSGINIICFRIRGTSDEFSDQATRELQEWLLKRNLCFLSLVPFRGNLYLRFVLLNPFTEIEYLKGISQAIREFLDQNNYPFAPVNRPD